METAAISCGTTMGWISLGSSLADLASASMIGPWSVPVFANRYRTDPVALTCSKKASAPVIALLSAMDPLLSRTLGKRIGPVQRQPLGKPHQLCQDWDDFSTAISIYTPRSALTRIAPGWYATNTYAHRRARSSGQIRRRIARRAQTNPRAADFYHRRRDGCRFI